MVFPARIADGDGSLAGQAIKEVSTQFQGAGAAERLCSNDAAGGEQGGVSAEQQLLHRLIVGCQAVNRQVGAGGMFGNAGFFGGLYCAQQRYFA